MQTYIKAGLFQAALLAFQSLMYFGVQKLEGPAHDMARACDRKIPFVPQAIFIYILWYPLIFLFPLALYGYAASLYPRYIAAILLDIVISSIIYLVYPTSFQRPEPSRHGISGLVLRLIYKGNYTGKNCMPSMHCSMCFLVILAALTCGNAEMTGGAVAAGCAMPAGLSAGACILAVLIVCSTVMTKQHVLIDVAAALPLALLCWATGGLII